MFRNKLNKLRQKNKLIVIVDFQYIFLNYFKYDMKKVLSVDFIFKSKKKSKAPDKKEDVSKKPEKKEVKK